MSGQYWMAFLASTVAAMAWWPQGAEACQACYGGGASAGTISGFFWGFVVMIVSVFVALGGLTIMIVRGVRASGPPKEAPYQTSLFES